MTQFPGYRGLLIPLIDGAYIMRRVRSTISERRRTHVDVIEFLILQAH